MSIDLNLGGLFAFIYVGTAWLGLCGDLRDLTALWSSVLCFPVPLAICYFYVAGCSKALQVMTKESNFLHNGTERRELGCSALGKELNWWRLSAARGLAFYRQFCQFMTAALCSTVECSLHWKLIPFEVANLRKFH